jgi:hypothetical protein
MTAAKVKVGLPYNVVSATCPRGWDCDVDKIAVMLRVFPMLEEETDVDVGDLEVVAVPA